MRDRGNSSWFLAAALILAVGLTPGSAQASATVTTFQLTCSAFTASGTSDSPYVTIFAENGSTGARYFVVVPVVGGSFTGTLQFPAAPSGTNFGLEVWGTLNPYTSIGDSGYYDGGDFFAQDQPTSCATAPTLGYGAFASLTVMLGLAGWFLIRRSAA